MFFDKLSYRRPFYAGAALLIMTLATGCNSIYDDMDDCPKEVVHKVELCYDMNMKFTDAFAREVKAVDLYVYSLDGKLVKTLHESGDRLAREHFTMEVDIPDGEYEIVAWCGLTEETRFAVNHNGDDILDKNECRMSVKEASGIRYIDESLAPLFHGRVHADFSGKDNEQPAKVNLTKNTNTLTVTLHHLSYSPIDSEDFNFTVVDDNTLLNYMNEPQENGDVEYRAYYKHTAEVTLPDASRGEEITSITSAIAELSLGRLSTMTAPRLIVSEAATGKRVIEIPLNDYLLMAKGFENSSLSDQEYLDRQDHYTANFFLNEDGSWYRNVIYINSWRIIHQSPVVGGK